MENLWRKFKAEDLREEKKMEKIYGRSKGVAGREPVTGRRGGFAEGRNIFLYLGII
jgi:hypothetical protein